MDDKTKLELYEKLDALKKQEREVSDSSYAPIVVKIIVFGMVGIILTTALIAILSKIIVK